jgi:thioredoxin reductase
MALMARAYNQAQKFGVEMAIPDQANRLGEGADGKDKRYLLNVGDDETVQARTIVVASGARYRRLDVRRAANQDLNVLILPMVGVAGAGLVTSGRGSLPGRRSA